MRTKREVIIAAIIIILSVCLLSCEKKNEVTASGTIVKDYSGREIIIPENAERIIPVGPVFAEYMCVVGAQDKIAGLARARHSFLLDRYLPDQDSYPLTGFGNAFSIEKLLELRPDLVFCSNDEGLINDIDKHGITAVGTYPKNMDELYEQINIIGIGSGKKEEAEKVVKFLKDEIDKAKKLTAGLKAKERPIVYYAREEMLETMGKGVQADAIEAAGGLNAASVIDEEHNSIIVSLENIYQWDPDVIILRSDSTLKPEDIYDDQVWGELKAVKNKQVYCGKYARTEFSLETPFGILEKGKWLQPDLFKDIDPDREYEEFLKLIDSFYDK